MDKGNINLKYPSFAVLGILEVGGWLEGKKGIGIREIKLFRERMGSKNFLMGYQDSF